MSTNGEHAEPGGAKKALFKEAQVQQITSIVDRRIAQLATPLLKEIETILPALRAIVARHQAQAEFFQWCTKLLKTVLTQQAQIVLAAALWIAIALFVVLATTWLGSLMDWSKALILRVVT